MKRQKKTSLIVTSILRNGNEILILKRSPRTKTMQNLWAGISGYLEPSEDLISRALVEIYEETKINGKELILDKILNQITINIKPDLTLIIQPFYFLSSTRTILLNWEHTEFRWINSYDLDNYKFVPMLKEILKFCFDRSN
ncbi:MAG TPA: NUDIX domain-containing protein [Candidatus Saccharimonadales bacterium]|nr:NUDIX domain-containing protein [Candidatus Saccharimonadales bacterium]